MSLRRDGWRGVVTLPRMAVVTVMAMTVVHEEVHQRTGEQQKKGQNAKQMNAMLVGQERRRGHDETDKDRPASRAPR